jgi:histidine triad (HIT) family protein
MSDSETDCIFCKIVRREVPAHIVYEDDQFLGFLDIHPQSPGHVQLIPKQHYRWVWDVPEAGVYFEIARKIAKAEQKTFGTDAVFSRIMGDEILHAHIWIFPNPKQAVGDPQNFTENAEKLKKAL